MPPLDRQQLHDFLSSGRHIMKLATLTPDGWPYVVPVWYDYDGETFMVAGRGKARWVAHIQNDPRVSLCIDTSDAPYTRVLIEATAEIVDSSWVPSSPQRAIRYLGEEAGRRYFEETRRVRRALARIVPRKIITWSGGEWHPRYRE